MFNKMTRKDIRTPAYWEANAPWYRLWLSHNDYHKPVKEALARFVRPGWRVLDVGGGSGLLSLFLRARGCRTVLLEPARAMLARLASALCRSEGHYRLAGTADLHLRWWTRRGRP